MIDFVLSYLPLLNLIILNCGLALSQYVVLRAGVFSVATAGLASIGAYTAGLLILRAGVPALVAVFGGALTGMIAALILSVPLARLRGVFQAIATVAMVQIILSIALYGDDITGGANGLNGIDRLVLPGMVDTHRHTWQALFRNIGSDWTSRPLSERSAWHGQRSLPR